MDDFKEFQGKSLDEAIRAACSYFDAQREKLEIDIVQDAKTASSAWSGRVRPSSAPAAHSSSPA